MPSRLSSLAQGYDESSSLDPLTDALDVYKSPAATRRLGSPLKSPSRQGSVVHNISHKPPSRQGSVVHNTHFSSNRSNISIVANSPTKTVTEKTLSPWKVRVTVEAEPEDADARFTMASHVTTSVTDLDIVVLGDDADSDEWSARKTWAMNRKKRKSAGRTDRSVSVTSETPSNDNAGFPIHDDKDEGIVASEEPTRATSASTELRQIDLNRVSVRPRTVQSIKEQDQSLRKVSVGSAVSYPTPSPTSSGDDDSDGMDKPNAGPVEIDTMDKPGAGPVELDEPNAGPVEFDTIMESEGFTMIDLDSIPSASRFRSTPVDASDNGPGPAMQTYGPAVQMCGPIVQSYGPAVPEARTQPQYKLVVDEETELSSTVPSSPPMTRSCDDSSLVQIPRPAPTGLRKVTPQGHYSSPRLPSPPPLFRSSQRGRGHQRTMSKEAINAGRVLQDLVSLARNDSLKTTPTTVDRQLYDGFSSGTQRELRTAEEDDDGADIWLEEAKAGSSSPREAEQHRQKEPVAEAKPKPRRHLLPSPWKRGEDIEPSTFLSNGGENSGIFWQKPQTGVFGAGDIAQAEKRWKSRTTTSTFDLDKMLNSPVKFAELGKESTLLHLTVENSQPQPSPSPSVLDSSDHSQPPPSPSVLDSSEPPPSPSPAPQRVPVNFNDSTPPRLTRLSPPAAQQQQCPSPTPRSAMKGARFSAAAGPVESPRKVVFNRRSMYLNEDGEESTMSAKLDSTSGGTEGERDDEEAGSPSSSFTNSHFRTLHIIHAKSLRPRFHAPRQLRPSLRRLVDSGWNMDVDVDWERNQEEEKNNSKNDRNKNIDGDSSLGEVFTWTLGPLEASVVERFMQECEYSCVLAGLAPDMASVQWGWSVQDVVRNLGMLVVGDVVRQEERKTSQ
ncbi:hypothetical protein DV735_g3530, partial [Chaetothyriales sp. CBS 134920]